MRSRDSPRLFALDDRGFAATLSPDAPRMRVPADSGVAHYQTPGAMHNLWTNVWTGVVSKRESSLNQHGQKRR
jgi:hypothetical protein